MPSPVLDYNNHIYHEVPDLQGNLQPIHRPIQAQLNLQQVSFNTFLWLGLGFKLYVHFHGFFKKANNILVSTLLMYTYVDNF